MQITDTIRIADVHRTIVKKVNNFIPNKYELLLTDTWNRTAYIKSNFSSWQYTGSGSWEEILLWCEKTFGDDWIWNFETIYFKYDKDRTVFLMRWA